MVSNMQKLQKNSKFSEKFFQSRAKYFKMAPQYLNTE